MGSRSDISQPQAWGVGMSQAASAAIIARAAGSEAGSETRSAPANAQLLGMPRQRLATFFATLGEPAFRAEQLMRWVHHCGVHRFADMHDMPSALRARLAARAALDAAPMGPARQSADGTLKWLLAVDHGAVETVFIPQRKRGTLCVSSQVGCSLNCDFCATGKQGFQRNLSSAEIVSQVWQAHRALEAFRPGKGRAITNVVMMGMGEPLLNLDAVVDAIAVMVDDFGYGLSRSRVTVSTAGVAPAIRKLAERAPVSLAISLHAPNDALRDVLVPINRKYPLAELMRACHDYLARLQHPRRVITVEYTMLDGVNDSDRCARDSAALLAGLACKINLIPFNPFPGSPYRRSAPERIARFRDILWQAGHLVTVRATRGSDIGAACGQLTGQVIDRSQRARRARRAQRIARGQAIANE